MASTLGIVKDLLFVGKDALTFAALMIGCYTSLITHRRLVCSHRDEPDKRW
jgi:hypothetical protein